MDNYPQRKRSRQSIRRERRKRVRAARAILDQVYQEYLEATRSPTQGDSSRVPTPPAYSPVSSPEPEEIPPPPSPTPSIEFLDEFDRVPPRPRHYYYNGTQNSLIELLEQFPVKTDLSLQNYREFTLTSEAIDPDVLFNVVSTLDPSDFILTFTPHYHDPFAVPVDFFYNFFPPSSVIIREII